MRNALLIVAACLIALGVGCVFWQAGVIAAGALLGAYVLLSE